MDITSYILGKKAGGGSQPVNLQDKEITITENGEQTITADSGYDGLSQVDITTNVSGSGDDWSDIGYSSTPDYIQDIHAHSKQIYDNWDADNPTNIGSSNDLIVCPLVDTSKKIGSGWFRNYYYLEEVPALVVSNNNNNLSNFFQYCRKLKYVDLSNFDTSNVTTFQSMFEQAGQTNNLTSLDLSSFNTSSATNMSSMFYECTQLTTLDLSSFNTSNVTNLIRFAGGCENLTHINFGNNFNTSKVTTMNYAFNNSRKLDNETLNAILGLCIGTTSAYTSTKTLATLGINSGFTNFANIPNLSNYQAFLDAGWTIS